MKQKSQKPRIGINSKIIAGDEEFVLRAIFPSKVNGKKEYFCMFTNTEGIEETLGLKEAESLCGL